MGAAPSFCAGEDMLFCKDSGNCERQFFRTVWGSSGRLIIIASNIYQALTMGQE